MVQRTPGHYDYHSVTGDAIREAAVHPGTHATALINLADDLEKDEQKAVSAVEGEIVSGVKKNPKAARDVSSTLGLTGQYAVGCLNKFALAVDRFDTLVNHINIAYSSATYGAHHDPDLRNPPPGGATLEDTLGDLRRTYDKKYAAAVSTLDQDALDVAADFAAGASPEAVKAMVVAGLIPFVAVARFPSITWTDAELAQLKKLLIKEGRLDEFFAAPPLGTPSTAIKALIDLARRMKLPPTQYADPLKFYYITKAAEKAGIDLTTWDVTLGTDGVADHYEKTYAYYNQLCLDNPYMKWAGMAGMIGPSFAAGFEDLELFKDLASGLANVKGGPWVGCR